MNLFCGEVFVLALAVGMGLTLACLLKRLTPIALKYLKNLNFKFCTALQPVCMDKACKGQQGKGGEAVRKEKQGSIPEQEKKKIQNKIEAIRHKIGDNTSNYFISYIDINLDRYQ